jgi:plasmid stabilization system protein ParE
MEIAAELVHELAERGMVGGATCAFATVAAQAGQPGRRKAKIQRQNAKMNGACTLSAFSLQPSAFRQQLAFFNYFKPEAREILNGLLEKYASNGERFGWYFAEAGEALAWRFFESVARTLFKLADQPDLGRQRLFRHPMLQGRWSFRVDRPFLRFLIFYRATSETLEAWRLTHGARDWPRRLAGPPGSE